MKIKFLLLHLIGFFCIKGIFSLTENGEVTALDLSVTINNHFSFPITESKYEGNCDGVNAIEVPFRTEFILYFDLVRDIWKEARAVGILNPKQANQGVYPLFHTYFSSQERHIRMNTESAVIVSRFADDKLVTNLGYLHGKIMNLELTLKSFDKLILNRCIPLKFSVAENARNIKPSFSTLIGAQKLFNHDTTEGAYHFVILNQDMIYERDNIHFGRYYIHPFDVDYFLKNHEIVVEVKNPKTKKKSSAWVKYLKKHGFSLPSPYKSIQTRNPNRVLKSYSLEPINSHVEND